LEKSLSDEEEISGQKGFPLRKGEAGTSPQTGD